MFRGAKKLTRKMLVLCAGLKQWAHRPSQVQIVSGLHKIHRLYLLPSLKLKLTGWLAACEAN